MTATRVKGLLFLFSGVFLAVCCFLPIRVMTSLMSDQSKIKENVSLMPSLPGFILFLLACVCIIVPLVGLQKKAPLVGVITAITTIGILVYITAKTVPAQMATNAAISEISVIAGLTTASDKLHPMLVSITYENGFGFYLMIIAALVVGVMSFFYGLAESDY
ncbi:MAG: hypothetical protein MJ103_00770 [Saccharofermentans sp.]|nr:hypothetical protein [Saccharofermentans sp.]